MMRGASRIAVVLLVACLGLATGSVACGGATAPRTLVHVGDSLAVGTDPYLPELLPGWTLTASASVGRRSDEGLVALQQLAAPLPRVLILSLGTNDNPADVEAFTATVREVTKLAGPRRCVVWTTISRPAVRGVSYAAFNRVLRGEAQRSSAFKIVDWAAMVARNPSYLRADRVHGVSAGYRARAQETARVAKRC
jgi:lysophospholipase L1-like esterase